MKNINRPTDSLSSASLTSPPEPIGYLCPACGGLLTFKSWGLSCNNYKSGCKYSIRKSISGKRLSEHQISTLFTKGKTKTIRGFISKNGKKFESKLVLENITDENGKISACNIAFDFTHSYPGGIIDYSTLNTFEKCHDEILSSNICSDIPCPSCGQAISQEKWAWRCSDSCGFSCNYTIAKRKINEDDLRHLVQHGKTDLLHGFISKSKKPFSAILKLAEDKKSVLFDFQDNCKPQS